MWWPRQGSYDKRPTAARVRLLVPLAALGALVAFGEPGALLSALIPQEGPAFDLPEYGRVFPAYSPWSASLMMSIAPFLAGALLLALVAGRYAERSEVAARAISARPPDALLRGERGVSAIEFMLLLPFLLIIMLTILQIALIVQAKFIVNYAAFCAVRSAVVVIPTKVKADGNKPEELANQIRPGDDNSQKMRAIKSAARIPCVAISPRVSGALITSVLGPSNLAFPDLDVDTALDLTKVAIATPTSHPGAEVLTQFAMRTPYAFLPSNTTVELTGGSVSGDITTYGISTGVAVKVTHRYFLAVPFASRFLGTKFNQVNLFGNTGFYVEISERYMLLNEGERTGRDQDVIE
jgi:hypothetical protein